MLQLERAAVTGRTEARSLIPLGARILRILLLFMGLVAVLATAHPKIASGNVKFSGFGDYSLNLEVLSWFDTTDLWEFRELRQRAGFEIMRLIERHGARLAVPVQRVLVSGGPLPATALQS